MRARFREDYFARMKIPLRSMALLFVALFSLGVVTTRGAQHSTKSVRSDAPVDEPVYVITKDGIFRLEKASIKPIRKARAVKRKTAAIKSPQYGRWGFDIAGADLPARAGDDFFRYANGAWLDRVQIPADKPAYSLRLAMTDKTEERLHELIEAVAAKAGHEPATTEGKVGAFYKSFMNEAAVEKAGALPLKDQIAEICAATTREALATLMGRQNADFFGSIFGIGIDVDIADPTRYVVYLGQAGFGLPDRDYYLKPEFAAQKLKYQAYVAQLLKLLEWPEAETRAGEIVNFETKIAEAAWTRAQQRDPVATYNPLSIAELKTARAELSMAAVSGRSRSRKSETRRRGGEVGLSENCHRLRRDAGRGLASVAGFHCRRPCRALPREAFRGRGL